MEKKKDQEKYDKGKRKMKSQLIIYVFTIFLLIYTKVPKGGTIDGPPVELDEKWINNKIKYKNYPKLNEGKTQITPKKIQKKRKILNFHPFNFPLGTPIILSRPSIVKIISPDSINPSLYVIAIRVIRQNPETRQRNQTIVEVNYL